MIDFEQKILLDRVTTLERTMSDVIRTLDKLTTLIEQQAAQSDRPLPITPKSDKHENKGD